MINIVLDTNIIISSRISAAGNTMKIMRLIADGQLNLYYNSEILNEYKRVLAYKKFNFSIESQKATIEDIENIGTIINPTASTILLPDESDRVFYDTAKAANAYLITGNLKHYPEEPHILTPTQFVEIFEK